MLVAAWIEQTNAELAKMLGHQDIHAAYQAGLRLDESERLDKFFGLWAATHPGGVAAALTEAPVVGLMTLVGRARRLVAEQTFVAEYLGGLGIENTPQVRTEVTRAIESVIPEVLSGLGLGGPAEDTLAQLREHAGLRLTDIPRYLEDEDNLSALPADLAEGIVRLREFSLAHPKSWSDRPRPPFLPAGLDEAVVAELRERPAGTQERTTAVGVAGREMRPRIIWDHHRGAVCVRLPEQRIDDTGQVTWRVSIGGQTKVYRTRPAAGENTGFSQVLDLALDKPVRELTVEDSTNGITWTVPVINSNDPVLIFNKRGMNIADKVSLHYNRLRVVAPREAVIMDPMGGGVIEPSRVTAIRHWEGWSCQEINAAGHHSISLRGSETVRAIDTRQRVSFRTPTAPIANLASAGGLPVYAGALIAQFPPTPSGQPETWQLMISSYGGIGATGEEVLPPETIEVPSGGGEFDVFDTTSYDAPWVGEYLVRLSGPRGESFRHECAFVEGLTATTVMQGPSSTVRVPSAGGLSEATMIFGHGPKPLHIQPTRLRVGVAEPSAVVVVTTEEGAQLPLRFIPPCLHFELPILSQPATWRTTRINLHPADINKEGSIRVRAPLTSPRVYARNKHGAPVGSAVMLSEDGGRTFTAPIAPLLGATSGSIDLEWIDTASDQRVSVTLADLVVTPARELSLSGQHIHLSGEPTDYHGVWLWPTSAPWVPAAEVPFHDGVATLPTDLIGAGPLVAQLHTRDRFAPLKNPSTPPAEATLLDQPGFYGDPNSPSGKLSALLAGESTTAPTDPETMPLLWDLLSAPTTTAETRHIIRRALATNPGQALRGMSRSLVDGGLQPGHLIRSGLVLCPFTTPDGLTQHQHINAWIGALEIAGALRTGSGEPAPLIAELKSLAGAGAVAILSTGHDKTLETACIDQSTVMLAGLPPEQQQVLLTHAFGGANIVPTAVLEENSRLYAVMQAFHRREEVGALLSAGTQIQAAVTLLRTLKASNRSLYAIARIRFDKLLGVDTDNPALRWTLAPAISLVFALMSRLVAHGHLPITKTLENVLGDWADVADLLPDIVQGDLVVADLLVADASSRL